MRACAVAEREGIPSVAVISSGFVRQARAIGRAIGVPWVPIAEYPGTIPIDTPQTRAEKSRGQVASAVIDGLLDATAADGESAGSAPAPEPSAREIVLTGTLDTINEQFAERLWSDGLPVIPPTIGRVEAFLQHTDRDPDEIIGVLPAEGREATVWSVAVNGVMAGCRPEYMPLLLAAVEAIADPAWRLQDGGATPGWEPLIVISGPVVKRLGFAYGPGLMRVGPVPNTSIGRFLRLYMRNVAGLRQPPGTTDKGSIGATFNVALAEDDEFTGQIGWDPLRVEAGFSAGDDVVTVQSVYAISQPIYTGGDPERQLALLAYVMGASAGMWLSISFITERWHPLLLLSPTVAESLAKAGYTKDRIRQYLFDHSTIEAHWLEEVAFQSGASDFQLSKLVPRGDARPVYGDIYDPDQLTPALMRPEWTNIVVAGDRGRNQSRIYFNNHGQGPPTSRRVQYTGR